MRTAIFDIEVDGTNISTTLTPIIISLSIKLDDKANADELTMELDDSGGQIELPRMGATVTAALGWDDTGAVVSFEGTVDTASSNGKGKKHEGGGHGGGGGKEHSAGGRGKGRTLTITAKSADMTGKLKERRSAHMDDADFGTVAQAFAKKAGITVKVDGALASVHRKYWAMANESFTDLGDPSRRAARRHLHHAQRRRRLHPALWRHLSLGAGPGVDRCCLGLEPDGMVDRPGAVAARLRHVRHALV